MGSKGTSGPAAGRRGAGGGIGGAELRSPAPAVVLSIHVKVGDRVEAGDRLALLEAMKTELPVVAPCAGVVGQVLVTSNATVSGTS